MTHQAILEFEEFRSSHSAQRSGVVNVSIGGTRVASLPVSPSDSEPSRLRLRPEGLHPGANLSLKLVMEAGFSLYYSAIVRGLGEPLNSLATPVYFCALLVVLSHMSILARSHSVLACPPVQYSVR